MYASFECGLPYARKFKNPGYLQTSSTTIRYSYYNSVIRISVYTRLFDAYTLFIILAGSIIRTGLHLSVLEIFNFLINNITLFNNLTIF